VSHLEQSILNSIKKVLNVGPDDTSFDEDILMHTNSTFAKLQQLGIGPDAGFMIEDDSTEWDTYLGDDLQLNMVKSYMWLCVRLLFDPPQMSHLIESLEHQKNELEWRLNVHREGTEWIDPNPVPTVIVC
jgi:hypothetical protein